MKQITDEVNTSDVFIEIRFINLLVIKFTGTLCNNISNNKMPKLESRPDQKSGYI